MNENIGLKVTMFRWGGLNAKLRVRVIVSNATFNNISAISWWLVVLVEEIEVSGENHRLAASHGQSLRILITSLVPSSSSYHIKFYRENHLVVTTLLVVNTNTIQP
jgi:hypothetical protein